MSYTLGGFIHVLLVLSIMVILSQMIRGNRGSRLAELDNSPSDGLGDKWK